VEIFKLFGSVFIKDEEASKSLSKIDEKAGNVGITLGGMIGTAAKWGAGIAAGAGVALAGVLALTNKSAEYADMIDKLSERTGINREELQRWKYAADQSGADITKLEVGVKTLSDVMDQAANGNKKAIEAFGELGVSLTDADGKARSTEAVFTDVMNALGDMEQGAKRNAIGNDLLGRSYTEMLPLLNAGSEGMDKLKTRADELGLVMSEEAVRANVKFGDTMADVKDSLGAVFMGIGTDLLPVMQRFLEWIIANMPEIRAFISDAIDKAANLFKALGDAIQFVIDNSNIILPILWGVTAAITAQAVIGTVTGLMKAWSATTKTQTTFQWLLNAALNANPLGLVALAIGALITVGVLLWKNWDTVKEKAAQLWTAIKEFFGKITDFGSKLWEDAKEWGKNIVQGLWNGLSSMEDWIKSKVEGFVESIGSTIKDFFGIASPSKLMAEYGNNIVEGLAGGITDNAGKAIGAVQGLGEKIKSKMEEWMESEVGKNISSAISQTHDWTMEQAEKARFVRMQVGNNGSISDEAYSDYQSKLDEMARGIAESQGVDLGVARDMAKTNIEQGKEVYGGITQHITINSPTPLSPSEIKRNLEQTSRKLAMEWGV
jgi:hypothetical protein